jgi:predicted dehydrogenase
MQLWSDRGCVALDFATRAATVVRPVTELLQREFDLDDVSPESRAHLKDHLFEDLLPIERYEAAAQNALLDELHDFASSIREHREPRVTGQQGRAVLAVAERVLKAIDNHAWDGHAGGRKGSMAMPAAAILRGPHWLPAAETMPRREAG